MHIYRIAMKVSRKLNIKKDDEGTEMANTGRDRRKIARII